MVNLVCWAVVIAIFIGLALFIRHELNAFGGRPTKEERAPQRVPLEQVRPLTNPHEALTFDAITRRLLDDDMAKVIRDVLEQEDDTP